MKTLILGLMLLGLTTLTFSQNEMALNNVNPNNPITKLKTNSNAIATNQISKRITNFQNEVSKYDITSKPIFTPNNLATYTVVFKEANNVITNVYNYAGEVVSSEQNFKAIRLPDTMVLSILKDYPNWSIKAVNCTIHYEKSERPLVTYKIKISSGTKTKTIKITE